MRSLVPATVLCGDGASGALPRGAGTTLEFWWCYLGRCGPLKKAIRGNGHGSGYVVSSLQQWVGTRRLTNMRVQIDRARVSHVPSRVHAACRLGGPCCRRVRGFEAVGHAIRRLGERVRAAGCLSSPDTIRLGVAYVLGINHRTDPADGFVSGWGM